MDLGHLALLFQTCCLKKRRSMSVWRSWSSLDCLWIYGVFILDLDSRLNHNCYFEIPLLLEGHFALHF